MGLIVVLFLIAAHALADPPAQFNRTELTAEQQRNLAEAERVVDAVAERLHTTLDLNSVWDDYFDPMAAGAGASLGNLTPEFEARISYDLRRRWKIAELNYLAAVMTYIFSCKRIVEGETEAEELFKCFPRGLREAIEQLEKADQLTFTNESEVEKLISELDRVTTELRRKIPFGWSQQSPAWENLRSFRHKQSDGEYLQSEMYLDSNGRERYEVYRDWWSVELQARDGAMKITRFGPIDE